MRLRNARDGEVCTDDICRGEAEGGPKALATNVIGGTRFTIDAGGTNGAPTSLAT